MKLGDSVHLKTLREYHILLYPCHLIYLPPANEVCEGHVLHVSVCPRGRAIPACIAGGIPACLVAGLGVGWYPNPRGKLRGIWLGVSRPTTKGEVEGDLARGGLQAHNQGGN